MTVDLRNTVVIAQKEFADHLYSMVSEYYFLIASHILEFESYEEKAKKTYENKEIRVFSLTERRSWYKSSQGYMQQ